MDALPPNQAKPPGQARFCSRDWIALAAVYVVFLGLMETSLMRPEHVFKGGRNSQIFEAQSWWDGHLDIPDRLIDTALVDGKVYSHFPPLFTLIAAAVVPLFGGVPHLFLVLLVSLPMPLLAYLLSRRLTETPAWAFCLSIAMICGTSLWPVMHRAIGSCSPYFVNHTLATMGLLIFLIEYFGRRRVWVMGLGLITAGLARQLTLAYGVPLLLLAWRSPETRSRNVVTAGLFLMVIVGLPMALNTLKFGHPLKTGYMAIYEGRTDRFADAAHEHGLFSPHFIKRNAYYANLGFPKFHEIEMGGETQWHWRPNTECTGIWWTTPLLIWLAFDWRRIFQDPATLGLLIGAVLIYIALLMFHATGADQRGYNRFSLDYLLVLLALVGPQCFAGRRRWLSVAMIGWSVVYFRFLI